MGHQYQRHDQSLTAKKHIKALLPVAKRSRKYHWLQQFDSIALQQACINLDKAFSHFFNPTLSACYPCFRRRYGKQSSYHCTGLAFGPDTNAGTGLDQTVYQLNLPSVDDEVIDTAFFLMRETADKLLFEPEAIDRERGVVASEQRFRDTFERRYIISFFQAFLPDTLIGFRGDDKQDAIASVSQEQFFRLYHDFYTPERTFFVVGGDVDPDVIETKIEETFASWEQPENPAPSPNIGSVASDRPFSAAFFFDPDIPTIIDIAVARPAVNPPDSTETRFETRLRQLANAILERRFDTLARQSDSSILQATAGFDTLFKTAESASIQLISSPERWEQALSLGEQELRRALEHGFTERELQEQINNFRAFLSDEADQANGRSSATLADAVVDAFHADAVYTDPLTEFERFESQVTSMTPEAVHEAFRAMWSMTLSMLRQMMFLHEILILLFEAVTVVSVGPRKKHC